MSANKIGFGISCNEETDSDVINKLRNVDSVSVYIKTLIRKDIGTYEEYLSKEKTTHTGRKLIDLTGMVFGNWTVLEREEKKYPGQQVGWKCVCKCGTVSCIPSQNLREGKSKGCGKCKTKKSELYGVPKGHATDAARNTYDAMIGRCYRKNHVSYKNYGGRGIRVCDDWLYDFRAFYDYVSKLDRFGEPGMTLDRIDNEKGYEPGNVRWATRAEQNKNKRKRK